jgi:hypothetical protein
MPADVVARVDDALRAAAGPTNVVPISAARGRARHASGRRRKFATGLAAAAAAAVAVIGGLAVVTNLDGAIQSGEPATALDSGAESGRGSGGAEAPTSAPQAPPAYPGGPVVVSTGTNYQMETLASSSLRRFDLMLGGPAPRPSAQGSKSAGEAVAPDLLSDAGAFQRLNNVATLQECLTAIAARHPGQALVVDYASFEGQPALVVLVAAPTAAVSGRPGVPGTVVVAGLACGVAGADVKAAVPTS